MNKPTIFKASEGKELVKVDSSNITLKIAAFLANNVEYYQAIVNGEEYQANANSELEYVGTSAHCYHARYLGLVTEEEHKKAVDTQDYALIADLHARRQKAKSMTYQAIYSNSTLEDINSTFLEATGLQNVVDNSHTFKQSKFESNLAKFIKYQSKNAIGQIFANIESKVSRGMEYDVKLVTGEDYWIILECDKGKGALLKEAIQKAQHEAEGALEIWYMLDREGEKPKITPSLLHEIAIGNEFTV